MASGTFRHPWVLCVLSAGAVFAAAAAAAASSDQTPTAPTENAAAQPAHSESAAPPASDSASKTKPADGTVHKVVLVDNDVTDIQLKQILAKGYRPESRNGKTVYCRKETPMGTRFETKTCSTSAAILSTEQLSREQTSQGQRVIGQPSGR